MKALWLTSWYPNQLDKFSGDFIQRHAYATSELCTINVIYVEAVSKNAISQKVFIQSAQQKNLSETVVLYKRSDLPVVGKLITYLNYLKLFKQQVYQYMHKNGKPDVVHVHVTMKAGLIALWIKKRLGLNFIVTEHSTMFTGNANDAFKNRSSIFKNSSINIFKQAALFLPVSKDLGNAINAITPVRFTVIYNCVNTNYFFYDASSQIKSFTFIHVSTLDTKKNPEDIIKAFIDFNKQQPSSKLIIVGQITPQLSRYLGRIKFPIEAIQFTGLISYKQVAEFMQQSNSLILFSRAENMPCVVLEALCCGLPVISSDVGGINEVINKDNGLFVSEYNAESLLQTMIKMYKDYHFYNRKKIAENAKADFAYSVISNEIISKYKEVYNIK